jgi:F0F1-type ATP synthase membrane subunit b/b'
MPKDPNTELRRARRKGRAIVEEAKIKALSIITEAYGDEIQKIASSIAVEFKNQAELELAEFKKDLEEKVVTIEIASEKVLGEEYDEIRKQIELYKESKMAQIDRTAREVLIDLTKNLLGKSIDLRAHEELLINSLEDAKRQNLF